MSYEELQKKLDSLDHSDRAELFSNIKDWALFHGLVMRSKENFHESSVWTAPFTMFPSPIPKAGFEKALAVQSTLNRLYHTLAYHPTFLQEALHKTIEYDDFTRRLCEIYSIVRKEGLSQTISCGLFRSDYLPHSDSSLKQVEMNTIASSMAGLISQVELAHRHILRELHMEEHLKNMPENESLTNLAFGLIKAWDLYGDKSAVIMMVVEDVTYNIADQRFLEFRIRELSPRVSVIRRTFSQLASDAYLTDDMRLFVGKKHVGVVYYRSGYDPSQYTEESWGARLLIERSAAIKCPSIQYHLAGTKKVQQVLCESGMLEKFLDEQEAARIKEMFVEIYPLDKSTEGERGYKLALTEPEDYVLKPQREGGGHNIYGSDIPKFLQSISRDEASSYILMQQIRATPSRNTILRSTENRLNVDIVSELGIYGIIIGNEKEIFHNEVGGHMLRTKLSTAREGGVAAGDGALDSPYLC